MPAERQVGDLTFRFLGFSPDGPTLRPTFQVLKQGVEMADWFPAEIEYSDATGNRMQGPFLCRHEPAWSVRAGFLRRPESLAGPAESCDVGPLRWPGPGEGATLDHSHEVDGVEVRLRAIGGPGVFRFQSGPVWKWELAEPQDRGVPRDSLSSTRGSAGGDQFRLSRSRPWVLLEIRGLRPDQRWALLRFGPGRQPQSNRGWSGVGHHLRICDFDPVEGPVRLRWVVQRVREAEFVVAPPAPAAD